MTSLRNNAQIVLCLAVFLCMIIMDAQGQYGTDISYPMFHESVSTNFDFLPHNVDPEHNPVPEEFRDMPLQPLGDRQAFFEKILDGCRKQFEYCDSSEKLRLRLINRQPRSMRNYTELGFKKVRVPESLFITLRKFWEKNRDNRSIERPGKGNIFMNHWEIDSHMVSVENSELQGGGLYFKRLIWEAVRPIVEEWTGQRLVETMLYGIRIYNNGAVLAPHVDKLPRVTSVIINIDQDVDEPWPLEVISHDGKAHNITMEPGDMVLYESHSTIHGRPFRMKGRLMANLFIHYEPIGPLEGKAEVNGEFPPYIIPGSPEEDNWALGNPNGHHLESGPHKLADLGDFEGLKRFLNRNPDLVDLKDKNGWTALHLTIRTGDEGILDLLLRNNANPYLRTGRDNKGQSVRELLDVYDHGTYRNQRLKDVLQKYGHVDQDGIKEEL